MERSKMGFRIILNMEFQNLVFIKTSFAKLIEAMSALCKFSLTNCQIIKIYNREAVLNKNTR